MTKRVLIVEDNPIEARAIELFVREAGYHVEVAGDAERGFARLVSEHFDVLLCDLHLPGEDGFTLCRRVKQADELRRIPVVLLTRHSDPLNFLRGLEAGADGFISKEQSATNICERLQRVLLHQEAEAKKPENGTDRVVFLQTEFAITSQRSQLLEVLLSGFEDVALLNAKYEEETHARVEAQRELRAANAMYISLVETLTVGVVRKDVDGKYAFANSKACEMLGRPSEEIVGKSDFDLFPREIAEQQRANDCRAMETGQTLEESIEHDNVCSGRRYFSLRRTPVRDSAGDIAGTQIVLSDITELKRAEAGLMQAKEAAESATVAKSQFLAGMSHELRTPLNGVIGMTELLAGTQLSEKQQQLVDMCRNSGESLLQLINDILDFSKIEAGKLELDLHDFDLEKLIADVVDTMAWRAHKKNLELPCYVDSNSRLVLKGDSGRLRQVLVNLIGNAVKFTKSGEVAVRTENVGQPDDRVIVRISVSDTGIGIPAHRRDRLFQSFSQVDASTTRQYGGTGLGLAISQSLVKLMGGTIGVESEEKVGSTFWFEVPFEVVSQSRGDSSADSPLAGRRVLIVDDNETNRIILAEYVGGWDIDCVTAASVDEALAAVDRADADGTPFHLVLTDYNMPQRSGLDLAKALSANPKTTMGASHGRAARHQSGVCGPGQNDHRQLTVLLVGSTDLDIEPDKLGEYGIDATLRKPLRRRVLYDVMCGVLAAAESHSTAAGNEPSTTIETELPMAELPTGHILLAEDNSINRLYILELMKQFGCTCVAVSNGCEALNAVEQGKYDLVLMDCQMPEMDGFEATRHIRQLEADGTLVGHLPIVALTANALKGDRERCLDAGMDDYLSKPMQAQRVASVLERFLGEANSQETQKHTTANSD